MPLKKNIKKVMVIGIAVVIALFVGVNLSNESTNEEIKEEEYIREIDDMDIMIHVIREKYGNEYIGCISDDTDDEYIDCNVYDEEGNLSYFLSINRDRYTDRLV
jgi:hypothetical protein